jgi:hypothetical protein
LQNLPFPDYKLRLVFALSFCGGRGKLQPNFHGIPFPFPNEKRLKKLFRFMSALARKFNSKYVNGRLKIVLEWQFTIAAGDFEVNTENFSVD